jgi:hypothetical protein
MAANTNKLGLVDLLSLAVIDPNAPATTTDSDLLSGGIQMDLAQHNADIDRLNNLHCETTEDYQVEVQTQATTRNQPLDERGRAIPIIPGGPYTIQVNIQESGSATGETYLARTLMTNKMLAARLSQMYRGDYLWVDDHQKHAIFYPLARTNRDLLGRGNLTTQPLAIASDGITYMRQNTGLASTDTHYYATASAYANNANPFSTIKNKLTEHSDNAGEVIAFVSTADYALISAMTDFYPLDRDGDFSIDPTVTRLTGTLNAVLPADATVRGKMLTSSVWIVERSSLPDNYGYALTSAGRRPLARRVIPDVRLQGFGPEGDRQDHPYFETQYTRREGYGALNRVGAVAFYVGVSGTYTAPTIYNTPFLR